MRVNSEGIKNNNIELTQFELVVIEVNVANVQSQPAKDELTLAFLQF